MYKKAIYTLRSNERLTPAVWRMTLEGDTQWITAPGQFVNVELDGCYLRRPISVCDWDERTITLIYKVVGEGTALMAGLRPGARLDLLTGLGNGFDVTKGSRRELLVGGGVCYTIGCIFYVLKKIPYMHSIFHLWVLAGTVCQFLAIAFYIM